MRALIPVPPRCRRIVAAALAALFCCSGSESWAQLVEHFEEAPLSLDPQGWNGWAFATGDGEAKGELRQEGGLGVVEVDARADRRNIWWAYIRRAVSPAIDQAELMRPDRELRVDARIRVSHAPRRVNLHFNHSRTEDFHTYLMEYDIPDADGWHEISLTTEGFDAAPEDAIYVQLALMDWGREQYRVEIDSIKVEVVDPRSSGPDRGGPMPYRPDPRPAEELRQNEPPVESAFVDQAYPWVNFAKWNSGHETGQPPLLSISGTQVTLLRWDLAAYRGSEVDGWGVLELATESAHWADTDLEEFGELRVVEILGGDPVWTRESVTLESFLAGAERLEEVVNGQMIVDWPLSQRSGSRTRIPIAPPALNRLLSGRSLGLAIYPQGALNAVFYGSGAASGLKPTLRFSLRTQ